MARSDSSLPASTDPATRRTPTRTVEIETKLEFDGGAGLPPLDGRPALAAAGVTGSAAPETFQLDATYYDTAGLDLLAAKLTLRRRTGGHDFGWHLKLPRVAGGRTEVAVPLTDHDAGQVPAELDRLVRGMARGRELRPVARLQTRRTVHHLLNADGAVLVEVADDAVTATDLTGRDGSAGAQHWREVEVELVDGTREQLAAVVDELRSAGARPASSASKVGRALNPPTVGTTKGKKKDAPDRTAGAVVADALDRTRTALLTADRGVREGVDGAAEEAAAALTSARALLGVCHPVLGRVDGLLERATVVADDLAAAQTVHHTHRRLIAQLSDEPEDYARQGRAVLTRTLATRAEAAAAQVADLVDTPEYLEVLRGLDEAVAGSARRRRAARPASGELPVLLGQAWDQLREGSDALLADPGRPENVRVVRSGTVALRLTIEALAPSLGEDAVLLAASLEEVEESLDEYRASARASALLTELSTDPGTDGVAGFVFGRLHAFEEALAHGALDDFTDAWDRVEDGDLVAALVR
ncbi:CYTH domain-containing protein [Nakamurella flavida]|uniref:CYTH domain-containing protein n=1 Tax=Nakamurella flavida TaxID=363630 RepID=A0A938YID1_9ACTN|nr:CYTH domain-containing protein [Nakamurella flavida]MBM9476497.1 CYTH domain-containing protein [Nakamurella flavida]MDP9779066.1 inorganic triphosphatase YgiF [Nakamurella flavida]